MRALFLICLGLLAACGKPEPNGESTDLPRFVSLNPCTDAILVEVADPAQILALSHYSNDPRASSMPEDHARQFPSTGSTVEETLAKNPDIVLAGSFLPTATATALERLGMQVETFGAPSSLAESEQQIRRLSMLAGQQARGVALIQRIRSALAETRHAGPPVDALLWQEGGITAGAGTLASAMLAHTGFTSHSLARGLGQGAYLPLERVLADPPDLVIAAGSERMLAHPALKKVAGLHYARLDPVLLYCAGPSLIALSHRLAEIRQELE